MRILSRFDFLNKIGEHVSNIEDITTNNLSSEEALSNYIFQVNYDKLLKYIINIKICDYVYDIKIDMFVYNNSKRYKDFIRVTDNSDSNLSRSHFIIKIKRRDDLIIEPIVSYVKDNGNKFLREYIYKYLPKYDIYIDRLDNFAIRYKDTKIQLSYEVDYYYDDSRNRDRDILEIFVKYINNDGILSDPILLVKIIGYDVLNKIIGQCMIDDPRLYKLKTNILKFEKIDKSKYEENAIKDIYDIANEEYINNNKSVFIIAYEYIVNKIKNIKKRLL